MRTFISSFILLSVMIPAAYAQDEHHGHKSGEKMQHGSEEVVQVLDDFRTAIIDNDGERASALLSDDARILESGGIETKEEYLSHHFHSDGKFLSAMERHITSQEVKSAENTAWISTVSHMSSTYNDQDVSINSAELAVLSKTNKGWKISAVHWSSRSVE